MSDNIIRFPRVSKRKRRMDDVLVDRLGDADVHPSMGFVPFTCPECHKRSSFDFSGLIFREVRFYCADCGHGYRCTNPMFSQSQAVVKRARG